MVILPYRRIHFRNNDTWTSNNAIISSYDNFLKAYYNMEDTLDSKGIHTLTNNGTISFSNVGKKNNCATLNGSNQYLSAAANADFHPGSGDFFFSMWINLSSDSGYQVFCGGAWSLNNRSWICYKHVNNTDIVFGYSTNGSSANDISFTWTPSTGSWINLSAGRAGENWQVYINGSKIGTTHNIGNNAIYSQADDPYYIGVDTGNGSYLNGYIDEHAFWKGMTFAGSNASERLASMDLLASSLYNSGNGSFLI